MNEIALRKHIGLIYQKYRDFLKDPGTPEKAKNVIRALGAIKDGKQITIKEEKGNDD